MSLLANYPFFFDGPEYMALSRLPLPEALRAAHPLAHPISILIWRVAYLGLGPSVTALSFVSFAFWILGAIAAAGCTQKGKRWIVYAVCFLLPLPWLVMTNVGVDAVSSSLFMVGVRMMFKQRNWKMVLGATALFGLSILNYIGMAVWLVIPIMILMLDNKLSLRMRMAMTASLGASVVIAVGTLYTIGLWNTKVGVGLASVPVAIYHGGVAFVANYTWVSAIVVGGFCIRWVMRREWQKLMIMAIMTVVYIVSLIPWHSGPYGRLGVFVIYALAYLYSRLPKWLGVVAIICVLPSWLGVVAAYQSKPLPILEQGLVEESACKDGQLIFSEIQRPQLAPVYPTAWYSGPINWQEIEARINEITQNGGKVCISQQALDYPYHQFEGQLPYPLSGKSEQRGSLDGSFQGVKRTVAGEVEGRPELTIYMISE